MICTGCGHDNPPTQKFCGECGARLASRCGACGAPNPPGPEVLRRMRPGAHRRIAAAPPLPRSRRLHAQASRRPHPDVEGCARGRTQARDGAVRRRQRLDGAARRPRPGRGEEHPRPGARAHDGGGASLRRDRQSGDGRRHHGVVRGAVGARGPRGARLLRRARHAGRRSAATPRRCAAATGSRSRSASASTRATSWSVRSATTCAWTIRRSDRRPIWRRAWSSWRPPV